MPISLTFLRDSLKAPGFCTTHPVRYSARNKREHPEHVVHAFNGGMKPLEITALGNSGYAKARRPHPAMSVLEFSTL